MSDFAGRVVLVAGGTGGLGRSVSVAFLAAGATTVVTYRKPAEFEGLRKAAAGAASRIDGQNADVTDEAGARALVDGALSRHGRLDAMVNAVGGYTGGDAIWDMDPKALDRMLDQNLRSVFALSRAAAPRMVERRTGAIVHVLSRAALDHGAGQAAYAASKAAALAMADSLAAELRGTGVRANAVLPSIIDTEANRKAMPAANFDSWPNPADIARVILFLCSDEARVVHGAAIPVYGAQ